MDSAAIIKKIQQEQPAAKLIDAQLLEVWAQQIIDKTHDSYTQPPPELLYVYAEERKFDLEEGDIMDNDEGFGDVVTVKGNQFVVCSGLVIPYELLHEQVLPMINKKMQDLGVTSDDIFNALMTE